jgi:flagellar assembly protein FliH
MSDVISREEAGSAERWRLPDVGGCERDRPSAQELEDLQKQAWDEAWDKAWQEGHAEGRKKGEQEAARAGQVIERIVGELTSLDEALTEALEKQLASLAMAVARQVIRRDLRTEPEHVIGAIRDALAVLPVNTTGVRVMLHPDDAKLVRERLTVPTGRSNWEIVEDPMVERGGCRVVSDTASVDASLETRIRQVAAHALGNDRRGDAQAEPFPDEPDSR